MARKTIRRNGRNITIDTSTGKEIKPGTAAWKRAGQLYTKLKKLPGDMVKQAKFAAKDISDNVIYSDKPDKKGRPQTIAQARVRKETADKNRKEGQRATLNGKPVVWKSGKWVSASTKRRGMANIPPAEGRPGSPSYVKPRPAPKVDTPKETAKKKAPNSEKRKAVNRKPAAPTPTEKAKSSADNMRTWALANKKMIEKSGTKTQKAILAKALKPKKKKSAALAIGGWS